jgi:hypothetical protein
MIFFFLPWLWNILPHRRDGEDQRSERLGVDRSGLRSGLEQKNLKVAPLR